MKIIDILSDDGHLVFFLQSCYHSMSFVRLYLCKLLSSKIVEV